MQLLDCAGGVKALGQQDDSIQEKEGGDAIDDVLHELDYVGKHGMVASDLGEVVLQNGDGASEGHMATATEEGHPGEAEDGSHQRGVGDTTQTLDTALKTTFFCPGSALGCPLM